MNTLPQDIDHLIGSTKVGSFKNITYKFRGSAGNSMHITVGVDEYGVIYSMFINVGASGSTVHNVCNSLARVISIAIQDNKASALRIVQTLEDVSSEVVWTNDNLGRADSIPSALALVLMNHIRLEEEIERLHSGEEEDELICPNEGLNTP